MTVIQVSAGSKYDANLVPNLPPAKGNSLNSAKDEKPGQPNEKSKK